MPQDNRVPSARYDGRPDTRSELGDEFTQAAYDMIEMCIKDELRVSRYDNCIVIDEQGLTVSCTVQSIKVEDKYYSAELMFLISHKLFDEPVCEFTRYTGDSAEEAVTNCASLFVFTVFTSIVSAFDNEDGEHILSDFGGRERSFAVSEDRPVFNIGERGEEPADMFSYVKRYVHNYLGSKNAYWLELYVYSIEGRSHSEVRLNGALLSGLSDRLRGYIDAMKIEDDFYSERQFVMLLDRSSPDDRKYTAAETVISLTKCAVDLLLSVTDRESDRIAYDRLVRVSGKQIRLANEIRVLVPELFTCEYLHIKRGDDIKLRMGNGFVPFKRTQLRNLGYIEQGIIQYLAENRLSRKLAWNIIRLSSLDEVIKESIRNGMTLDEITLTELVLGVPDDYELL